MLDFQLIPNMSQSWLYFMSEALSEKDIALLHQLSDVRTENGNSIEQEMHYVMAFPIREWRFSTLDPQTVEALFRIQVVTSQKPGQILYAYTQNLNIQMQVQDILFGDSRRVNGYSTGGELYAIPLQSFSSEGEVDSVIDTFGIRYKNGNSWRDLTSNGADIQTWALDIPVTVTK